METDLHHVIESLKLRKNGIREVNYELNDSTVIRSQELMGWRYVSLSVRNKKLNGNRYYIYNDDNNHHSRNRHNNRNDQQDAIIRRRRRIRWVRMKFVAWKCETVSAHPSCHNSASRIGGLRRPTLIRSSFDSLSSPRIFALFFNRPD